LVQSDPLKKRKILLATHPSTMIIVSSFIADFTFKTISRQPADRSFNEDVAHPPKF
jgi:hypothetical protein